MVGDERARRHRAQLVRAAGENEQHPALRQLARHYVHDRHAGVVRRMQVVGHQHHRTLLRRRLDRLEHRVRQPQRDHLGRPLQRPRHARERLQDLRRHPCQLAQRLRRGAPDRPLQRELLDQLRKHGERQLALGRVRLRSRHHRPFHLARRDKRVRERRLADSRLARDHHDPGRAAPHLEPGVVQRRELCLPSDQRLRLEALLLTLGHRRRCCRPRRRPPAFAQQSRDAGELRARLGAELFGERRGEAGVDLERVAAVAHPGPRFHQAPHPLLGEGIELVQHLRVPLHRREIPDPPAGVHLLHETVANPGLQLRPPLVLPLLERHRPRHLEAVEEGPAHGDVAAGEMLQVHIHPARGERHSGALHQQVLAADGVPDNGQRLRQGVAGQGGCGRRPEQLHQVVAREALTRLDREPDQEGKVLASA